MHTFLCLILILTAAWMRFYAATREVFNGVEEARREVARLKSANAKDHLSLALQREQFLEFRQNVATLMPDVLKKNGLGEAGYTYRNLASVVTKSEAEQIRSSLAKTLFDRAKEAFQKKDFARAETLFQKVIDNYGYSSFVVESYFLLSESLFQENELERCTAVIQQMVDLFPHHELTGFALVRLGSIYQAQNRNEEAVDLYKTVMRSFPQRDVASQAKASLRGLDL